MRLARVVLKVAGVYVVIGPLIGLVVFAIGVVGIAVNKGVMEAAWLGPFFLIYGILFAHFTGAVWALLAGLVAAVISLARGEASAWIGVISGLVSWSVALASGMARLPPGPDSPIGAQIDDLGPWSVGVMLLTHVIAASLCWTIARRLVRLDLSRSR